MNVSSVRRLAATAIVAVGSFGVFVLPWFTPQSTTPVVSDSYAMGFSNLVAIAALLLTACALVLLYRDSTTADRDLPQEEVAPTASHHRALIVLVILCAGSLLLGVGLALLTRGVPHNESAFFIDRATQLTGGYLPFVDFDYGYALGGLFGTVWLWRLFGSSGLTPVTAYVLVYCAFALVSCWMLYVVVKRLTPDDRRRAWILAAVGGVAIVNTTMGIQYLMVRYLTPAVVLIGLHLWFTSAPRSGLRTALGGAALALGGLALTIVLASPEMAIAGSAAILAYLLILSRTQRRTALVTGAALIGCLLAVLAAGGGYLALVMTFARGAYNLPVLPGPPAILYVVAVAAVAVLLPGILRETVAEQRPLLVGLVVLGAALVPAAFGRADFGHILFNGLVVFVLAAAFIARRRPRLFIPFLIVVAASFAVAEGAYITKFMSPILLSSVAEAGTLTDRQFASLERILRVPQVDQSALILPRSAFVSADLDPYSKIAAPWGFGPLDSSLAFSLASQRRLVVDPVAGLGFTPSDVDRKSAALADADCLLIPITYASAIEQSTRQNTPATSWMARPEPVTYTSLALFPLALYERRPQPNQFGRFAVYINENFRRIGTWGCYAVYVPRRA